MRIERKRGVDQPDSRVLQPQLCSLISLRTARTPSEKRGESRFVSLDGGVRVVGVESDEEGCSLLDEIRSRRRSIGGKRGGLSIHDRERRLDQYESTTQLLAEEEGLSA